MAVKAVEMKGAALAERQTAGLRRRTAAPCSDPAPKSPVSRATVDAGMPYTRERDAPRGKAATEGMVVEAGAAWTGRIRGRCRRRQAGFRRRVRLASPGARKPCITGCNGPSASLASRIKRKGVRRGPLLCIPRQDSPAAQPGSTTTGVPTRTRSCRSMMSWLNRRMQPDDTAVPMEEGTLVPCSRYIVSRPPRWR